MVRAPPRLRLLVDVVRGRRAELEESCSPYHRYPPAPTHRSHYEATTLSRVTSPRARPNCRPIPRPPATRGTPSRRTSGESLSECFEETRGEGRACHGEKHRPTPGWPVGIVSPDQLGLRLSISVPGVSLSRIGGLSIDGRDPVRSPPQFETARAIVSPGSTRSRRHRRRGAQRCTSETGGREVTPVPGRPGSGWVANSSTIQALSPCPSASIPKVRYHNVTGREQYSGQPCGPPSPGHSHVHAPRTPNDGSPNKKATAPWSREASLAVR